jgi:hypothetical protein
MCFFVHITLCTDFPLLLTSFRIYDFALPTCATLDRLGCLKVVLITDTNSHRALHGLEPFGFSHFLLADTIS